MVFEKNQRWEIAGVPMQVIVADEESAALAPIKYIKKHKCWRTNFEKVKIWSNLEEFRDGIPGLKRIGS